MFNIYIYLWFITTLKLTYCLLLNKTNIIAVFIIKSFLPALFEMLNLFWVQTLVEKPHFLICLRRLKVSFVTIYQK